MLPVFQAPTRDLNTTAALSLISLGACQVFGIRKRGFKKYMHTFIEPTALMLPMTLMSQLSSRLSMALRLFGNVMAGEVIGAVMFMLLPVLAPLPLNILSLITSILQALVFTVLTLVYVIEAIGTQEKQATISEQENS
jgi:F-type H+-transporting ATPase subunit a